MTNHVKHQIGLVIFPRMTQLDITGPYQVFAYMPNTRVYLLWKTLEPVKSNCGMTILPTTTFDACPPLDVVCVPGGPGHVEMMQDQAVLQFLQRQGKTARYITSVCSGSMILAAAGLLQGYRAACHWTIRNQLAMLGVEVGTERVVVDRNRITGGGVTAGIDFGLVVASKLCDEETAKLIQLVLEYNPSPPFNAGSPETAGVALVEQVQKLGEQFIEASLTVAKQTAAELGVETSSGQSAR